jgi:steroid delta-isomerase-like uncharacterized protein
MEAGDVHGPAGFREARAALLEALPDVHIEVEATVGSGDDVALRWRVRGTHRGAGLGVPASGRRVEFRGISWFRFADGRMIEGWDAWNLGGLLARLSAPEA